VDIFYVTTQHDPELSDYDNRRLYRNSDLWEPGHEDSLHVRETPGDVWVSVLRHVGRGYSSAAVQVKRHFGVEATVIPLSRAQFEAKVREVCQKHNPQNKKIVGLYNYGRTDPSSGRSSISFAR